jgi:hypothetical protein
MLSLFVFCAFQVQRGDNPFGCIVSGRQRNFLMGLFAFVFVQPLCGEKREMCVLKQRETLCAITGDLLGALKSCKRLFAVKRVAQQVGSNVCKLLCNSLATPLKY